MGSGFSTRTYRSRPGRTTACTCEDSRWSSERVTVVGYDKPEDVSDEESGAEENGKPKRTKALAVKRLDLNVTENAELHHTGDYEITEEYVDVADGETKPPQLVVRRGEKYNIKVTFNKPYDKDVDVVKVVFEMGDRPMVSKGTRVVMPVHKGLKPRHWSVCCNSEDEEMTITVLTPPTCFVGKWDLRLETRLQDDDAKTRRYQHKYPVYILFNPWCKEDQVYMEDEVWRSECVLNDRGRIYSGSSSRVRNKPWNFGQFEDFIIDCVMHLLDISMRPTERGNVVRVARAISAFVNAPDDGGVLVGNWSGDYSGGTKPTQWVGSTKILREFWRTRKSVQYGQCWVFSGLVTTVGRALGIPTRSVTNFASAHDTDGSVTIDTFIDSEGKRFNHPDSDSIWNFHVWNEGWMARPDLPTGYGGWQAFDATPQETSEGIYCAGPASVRAIKQGDIATPCDTPFIFAEVNADRFYWKFSDKEGDFVVSSVDEDCVGKKISTKKPWSDQREDVTHLYKYPEDSNEERAAVYRAGMNSRRPRTFDTGRRDVKFELKEMEEDIMVGSNFEVVLKVQNKSREERKVSVQIMLFSVYYTGVSNKLVKTLNQDLQLGAIQGEEISMRVTTEEYLHLMVEQSGFKVRIVAFVEETNQSFISDEDFTLSRPDLVLQVPSSVSVKEEFVCTIKLENTMPHHLTKCSWDVEGPKLIKGSMEFPQKDLEPYEKTELEVKLKAPKKKGLYVLMASFDSMELMDITGQVDVTVVD